MSQSFMCAKCSWTLHLKFTLVNGLIFKTIKMNEHEIKEIATRIIGFSNGPSWLIGFSWLKNMYILMRR
jgi:hypothetical protein